MLAKSSFALLSLTLQRINVSQLSNSGPDKDFGGGGSFSIKFSFDAGGGGGGGCVNFKVFNIKGKNCMFCLVVDRSQNSISKK